MPIYPDFDFHSRYGRSFSQVVEFWASGMAIA
jgi:hypothetical protein